jgi:hypothetical protein
VDDNLTAIFGIFCAFGLPVGAFIVFRVLAHRERMEMIRQGMVPPSRRMRAADFPSDPRVYGRAAAESVGPDAAKMLRKGVGLAFIGMALTIGLVFVGYHPGEVTHVGGVVVREGSYFTYGPWLLGGLIPLFIGLSQVVIAFLTDPMLFARFRTGGPEGGFTSGARYAEPPPQNPPGSDGPYTYRPGGRQELRPPTPPPTKRP